MKRIYRTKNNNDPITKTSNSTSGSLKTWRTIEKNKIISVSSLFKTQQKQSSKLDYSLSIFTATKQSEKQYYKKKKNKAIIKQTKGHNKATPSDQNET